VENNIQVEIDISGLTDVELADLHVAIEAAKADHSIAKVSEKQGPGVPEERDLGPAEVVTLLIITGAVVGVGLILRALPLGQLIDLRTDPPKTKLKWGLNSKLLLVIGVDGKVEIKANEGEDVLDAAMELLLKLFQASIKTVAEITAAVKDALGSKVDVTSMPLS